MRKVIINCVRACVLVLTVLFAGQYTGPVSAEPILKGYSNYQTLHQQVVALAKDNPLVNLKVLAKTPGQREIQLLTITRGGEADKKPGILIVGGVHAAHIAGSELAMEMAKQIVKSADQNEEIKSLLDQYTLYVIPRANPDAAEAFFTKPYTERNGNDTNTDDDRDAETDEDDVDDLDKDGYITMMRIKDPAGDYIFHPDDPRILIKADSKKGEIGRWRLLQEGLDNDQDESVNEDGVGGVDFNKNFPFDYPYFQAGAGPHMASEPEVRAVIDFAYDHVNIVSVLSFTPEDNLFHVWKPGGRKGRIVVNIEGADAEYANQLAEAYRKLHGGKDAPASAKTQGSFSSWAYFHYGRWSLAARGWWVPQIELKKEQNKEKQGDAKPDDKKKDTAKKKETEKRGADDINFLRYLEQEKIDGFVAWKKINHPDYPGKHVEIGGFKPFLRLNPKHDQLSPLAAKHVDFLKQLANKMPKLKFTQTQVEDLGGGISRLTVEVMNEGVLPTALRMTEIAGRTPRLQIALDLPEKVSLLTNHKRTSISALSGSGGRTKHVWLIRNETGKEAEIKISVYSPMVHDIQTSVKIK